MSHLNVSNIALLRFIGHRDGIDVEELRAELAASLERAHRAARDLGASDFLIKRDGLLFVIRGEQVTTVTVEAGPVVAAATLANRTV